MMNEAAQAAAPISKAGQELIDRAQRLTAAHGYLMELYAQRERLNEAIHKTAQEVVDHNEAIHNLLNVHRPDEPPGAPPQPVYAGPRLNSERW